jgi:hypothetical protein
MFLGVTGSRTLRPGTSGTVACSHLALHAHLEAYPPAGSGASARIACQWWTLGQRWGGHVGTATIRPACGCRPGEAGCPLASATADSATYAHVAGRLAHGIGSASDLRISHQHVARCAPQPHWVNRSSSAGCPQLWKLAKHDARPVRVLLARVLPFLRRSVSHHVPPSHDLRSRRLEPAELSAGGSPSTTCSLGYAAWSSRIALASFSAVATTVQCRFACGTVGKIEASATRSPATP